MSDPVARWVVRGGGLPGWAAAAVLKAQLPADAEVVLVTDGAPPLLGSLAIATLDAESILLATCDRLPGDLLVDLGGGFHLGTALADWVGRDAAWVCAQEPLPQYEGVAMHDLVLATARALKREGDYAGFYAPLRFQARVAAAGRYAEPAADRASPRSLLRPGIMVDADRLADALEARARALGVLVADTMPEGEARLVIDTRPTPDPTGWVDATDTLGFDRVVEVLLPADASRAPHLTSRPAPAGTVTTAPLRDGTFTVLAYDSRQASAEEARGWLGEAVVISDTGAPAGWAERPWRGGTLALGPAAACLGPVFGHDLVLLDRQLARLVRLLPGGEGDREACAREYNRRHATDVGHHADLLRAALRRCARPEPWWAERRAQAPSTALGRRLRQFQLRNRSVPIDGDPFDGQLWLSTFIALGYVPRAGNPRAGQLDPKRIAAHLGQTVQAFDATLQGMPTHDEVLDRLNADPAAYEWPTEFADL